LQGYYENHRDDMNHAVAWYASNDRFPPHFHHSIELVYVLQGELHATQNGETISVTEGKLLINSSYTIHSYATPASSYAIFAIIPLAEVPSSRQLLSKQSFAVSVLRDDQEGTLLSLMKMLAAAQGAQPLVKKGLSYTLIGLLIDRAGLIEARVNSRTAFIRGVLDYLQQHHTEPVTAQGVASHFGYSRSRFSHLFNQHLGYSLTEYVGLLRCQHAALLLAEADMAVSDVAMAVGFESLRTFYRTFKKQYKMTPNRYANL